MFYCFLITSLRGGGVTYKEVLDILGMWAEEHVHCYRSNDNYVCMYVKPNPPTEFSHDLFRVWLLFLHMRVGVPEAFKLL